MSNSLEVREAAARAAAEIRRRGWTQGQMFSSDDKDNCKVCLLGAVMFAVDGVHQHADGVLDVTWPPQAYAVEHAIAGHLPDPWGRVDDVSGWNDTPHRTVDEVLAVLDQVAAA